MAAAATAAEAKRPIIMSVVVISLAREVRAINERRALWNKAPAAAAAAAAGLDRSTPSSLFSLNFFPSSSHHIA